MRHTRGNVGPSASVTAPGRSVLSLLCAAAIGLGGAAIGVTGTGTLASAAPPAPRPTSTDASPSAPDPHPPAGGTAPNGAVPGGARLAGRGIILPVGAPALPKNLTARSWILTDLDSGAVLAARDPHGRYQPASILKTLTALTLIPKLPGRQVVTVSATAAAAEGSAVGLLAGSRYTVDQLFQALLLVSGNDAAAALAEANGGAPRTVRDMNATAAALGAYDTLVQTPSGLDGWQQLTSAYDMSLFLRAALGLPRFIAYDRLASATWPPHVSSSGKKVGVYQFDNQSENFLSTVPGALVAKTGYTDAALHTYICAAERNGHRLGVVFLRNQRAPLDQFQQAAALLNWGFALKPTVRPVGMLAGPISASDPVAGVPGSGSGSGSAPSGSPLAAAGRTTTAVPPGRPGAAIGRTPPATHVVRNGLGASAGVLLLAAVGAAGLRRRLRRSPLRR